MRFAEPNMLWLLLLVILAGFGMAWAMNHRENLARRFGTTKALQRYHLLPGTFSYWLRSGLILLGFAAIVIALARPQWGFHDRRIISRGVDMVIAIDTSQSMMAPDMPPTRMARAKDLLQNLIWEAKGSRVGIVAFAGSAVVMCPLTLDYGMAATTLKAVDTNTLSAQGTNIGAAVAASLNAFEISGGNDRVLILLTDGEQMERTDELKATVKRAADEGVRIFAIGIGSANGSTIPTMRGPKKDATGQTVITKLDMKQLDEISQATQGEAIRAEKIGAAEIGEISAKLAGFKGQQQEDRSVRVYHERFPWFIAAAIILFLAEALIRYAGRKRLGRVHGLAGIIMFIAMLIASPGFESLGHAYPGESFFKSREAFQKYNAGEYDEALALYQRAAELTPSDPQVNYNLGAAAAKAKKTDIARKAFRTVYDPENPVLNADALFGATTLDHLDIRADIKKNKEEWDKALLQGQGDEAKSKTDVNAAIEKLKKVVEEYRQTIVAKPDDVAMKSNFELARKDLQELEDLLRQHEQQKQEQQKDQPQQNEDDKKDEQKDKPQEGEGQNNPQEGDQGKEQKPDQKPQENKQPNDQNKDQKGQGQDKKDDKSDQGAEKQNQPGQGEEKPQGKNEGDQTDQQGQPDPKATPTPTPKPSPTPSSTPAPQPGQGQPGEQGKDGQPGAQGTPVPIGEMSPEDVRRLLNTLPGEDQNAIKRFYGTPDTSRDDMKNDW